MVDRLAEFAVAALAGVLPEGRVPIGATVAPVPAPVCAALGPPTARSTRGGDPPGDELLVRLAAWATAPSKAVLLADAPVCGLAELLARGPPVADSLPELGAPGPPASVAETGVCASPAAGGGTPRPRS